METQIASVAWEWIQNLWIAVLGLFGWHIRTQAQRLKDLADKKADKNEMNGAFQELRETIRHGFDQTHVDINSMHERIDKLKDK